MAIGLLGLFNGRRCLNVHNQVPTFYLYGEPHRSAADNFVHIERLEDVYGRS